MTMDIAALRRDTPACASVLQFQQRGFLAPPAVVVDMVVEHLRREATSAATRPRRRRASASTRSTARSPGT